MAESNDLDLGDEKKSSKLLYIILGGVVALLVTIGATLYFTGFFSAGDDESESVEESEQEEVAKGDPIYQPLGENFIVRFKRGDGARLLQVAITALIYDDDVVEAVTKHMPMIRNNLLLLLGGRTPTELKSPEGKEALRQEVLESVQKVVEDQLSKKGVEQVFFTEFVMQ